MKNEIQETIESFFEQEDVREVIGMDLDINKKIYSLLSESMFALMLVTTLEDEYDIEYNDNDIDLSFFSEGIDKIITLTEKYL
jgi:acyl carrier protein